MLKRFDITIKTELEEPLLGLADVLGVSAFSSPVIKDVKGQGESETKFLYTGKTVVSFIVSVDNQDHREIKRSVEAFLTENSLDSDALVISQYVKDQDWMANFKEHFKPIVVGDKIVVRPPWEKPLPLEVGADVKVVLIDPGMAFGTGTHETTRLCLELLEEIKVENQSFIDLGAGSGILSFYLLMRGAASGVALEIEGAAVENMRENAELNEIDKESLTMLCTDIISYEPKEIFDGLVANITSPVIIEHLAVFTPWVKQGGWGIFSGINTTNAPEVKETFEAFGWKIEKEIVENDWCGFTLRKQ